jgi:tetratricopeptide (TPR) repeat protein
MGLASALTRAASAELDAETRALLDDLTNAAPRTNAAAPATNTPPAGAINDALRDSHETLQTTNLFASSVLGTTRQDREKQLRELEERLEIARRQRLTRLYAQATPTFISILQTNSPEEMKRTALLELAICAHEQNQLTKAQQIFAHFIARWPEDPSVPEVVLRQGLIFRQMGMNSLALTKFYAVMTTSLTLKSEKLEYYQRLVLQAQTEIAETYFQQGKFQDSVDYFSRLLKLNSPMLNKPQVHFKLVRSLASLGRHEEAANQAYDFLNRHKESPEQGEVRFYLATSLKQMGRNNDSLQQVLLLLQDQQGQARANPQTWAYWQQRTGNEIANQLYKEGDYLRALEVYSGLAALSTAIEWHWPVSYQVGLTYERLQQPVRALEQYAGIIRRAPELPTNAAPSLRTILDMARWRQQHLSWQTNAEVLSRDLHTARPATNAQTAALTP